MIMNRLHVNHNLRCRVTASNGVQEMSWIEGAFNSVSEPPPKLLFGDGSLYEFDGVHGVELCVVKGSEGIRMR